MSAKKSGRNGTKANTTARGYGWKHQKWAKAVLEKCPTCVDCGQPSTDADHVVPFEKGGAKYDVANGVGRCTTCHAEKTARDQVKKVQAGEGYKRHGWLLPTFDPRRGKGPKKGAPNAGRPPDAFKAFLRTLRDSPHFRRRITALALEDPDPDRTRRFAMWLLDRTDGRPVLPIRLPKADDSDNLREMSNERFLAYVHQLEAEVAAGRRAEAATGAGGTRTAGVRS